MPKNAIIAQFYKTVSTAEKRAKELRRLWGGKIAFYVLEANNGYFVISDRQARLCFPYLDFSYKDRRYGNK